MIIKSDILFTRFFNLEIKGTRAKNVRINSKQKSIAVLTDQN